MKKTLIFLIFASFFGCDNLEDKIEGFWTVDQIYFSNAPVAWTLPYNAFELNKDNIAVLPHQPVDFSDFIIEDIGKWELNQVKGIYFLRIETANRLFNRNFQVSNFRIEQDSVSFGYFIKMSLLSDSLKIDCKKIITHIEQ